MSNHLRWMLVPSLMLGLGVSAYSERVDVNDARLVASEFFKAGSLENPVEIKSDPVYVAGSASKPLYYVFNSTDGKGFVIISAEDSTSPVLGYSFESSFPEKSVPDAMQWMMAGIEKELAAAPSVQNSRSVSDRRRIARMAGERGAEEKLLKTADWSQEAPFNAMIPGKPLVGCVGTAMATIMKYHQWPVVGKGSFGGVDFNTPYVWGSMRSDNYRSGYTAAEGDAVATLMYHASKSIDTQYAMSGSSAYEVRVPAALTNYFGYDPGVSYKKRSEVSTQQAWDKIVKDEIDAGRPVLYCGQDVTAGHAFVCDGYQGEYLHFNWGWGGSANGYFLSTALNPTVSRTHHYNNLNTIIYNIKPASGTITQWSPIHITADGNQPGIGSDLTDLSSGKNFTVRVGNLKNLSYDDFSGKIAVGLCGADGAVKSLLSGESSLSLAAMSMLYNGYVDFSKCSLPSGVSVAEGDKVRIVTKADGSTDWLPVAGELLTVNELSPVSEPALFHISLPSGIAGVNVEGEENVIRGWNYSFKAVPANPDEDVVTVKTNGYVLTPGNNYQYTIANVCSDQEISILVQKASEVVAKRSVWVGTPGTLSAVLPEEEAASVKELTLFGTMDARDFAYIKSSMRPEKIDLSGVHISAHGTDQANAVPREAFRGMGTLQEVVLPSSINRMNNGCFRQCGITTITIPAGVKTYEYNVFVGASNLRHIYVGREAAEFINWCVLSGVKTDLVTLHVPTERAVTNYKNAENWNTIANIVVDPIVASDKAVFAVMDNKEVQFDCDLATGEVEKGTQVSFTARHIGNNDNRMEVYANSTLLTPDADGKYTASINGNTILHFDMIPPVEIGTTKSYWSLTAKNGSIGLFTDAVNVLPGQEFTVRVNALNIPEDLDQLFWGMALTDSAGNIKEFISPVSLWTAGAGDGFKMNVNCVVKDSEIREGNMLRLVTSVSKKIWNIVERADESITDALPALNNMTPVYNISIPAVDGATVSGAVATAVRGRDITLKIVPNNAAYRIDLIENGKEVVKESPSVNYTFVAMEDKTFDIKVYDPKEYGSVVYDVKPGELYKAVTAQSIRAHVIVVGEIYASDLSLAFTQLFAQKTVKRLDLSGVKIVAQNGSNANTIPAEVFYKSSGIGQSVPVVEEIILPNSVETIASAAFKNCANIKDITLPESLLTVPMERTTASGGKVYTYGLGDNAFMGCTSLTTIRIPGKPGEYNGKMTVAHHNPSNYAWYNMGHADASKVTVIVPQEYLSVYQAANSDRTYGNVWKSHGYNILAEYPVYSLNFDPNRCVAEGVDLLKAASFLGDDVKTPSVTLEGKLKLKDPQANCKVYDNGEPVELAADGSIPVTFHNPGVNPEKSGNHDIAVVYLHDLGFKSTSSLFAISVPEVSNEGGYHFEEFNNSDLLSPVLKGVAENSSVRFRVDFSPEHGDGLEARVMSGQQEILPDEDGYYAVEITNAGKDLDIFAVPTNGATLNEEELAAIDPSQSSAITSIALEGEMSAETFGKAMECFPVLESLDLTDYKGELPAEAFAGMKSLETVALPDVEEIGKNMFNGCSSLQSVDVPNSVVSIGEGAFKDCESLESIRLTGVSSIGEGAFDGCSNLTTITLLVDNTSTPAPVAKRSRTRGGAGMDAKAFEGMNPNCIIILDEGIEQPQAVANYVRTATGMVTEISPDGSVTEREGRVYSAATPITLTEGQPLAIPHAFTLEDGASISLESTAGNWKGIVVPFAVEQIKDASGKALAISGDAANDEEEGYCMLFGIKDNRANLERLSGIAANTPYMFRSMNEGKVVFSATSGKIPSTPESIVTEGKDYSLHAVYKASEVPASSTYLLNKEAYAFEPVSTEEENVEIAPFGVYATSPASVAEILTELPGAKPSSGVSDNLTEGEFKVVKEGRNLVIYSPSAGVETLYSADGKTLRVIRIHAGRNVISVPESGIFIIRNTKVIF